jgi:hypothetical protein
MEIELGLQVRNRYRDACDDRGFKSLTATTARDLAWDVGRAGDDLH